MLDGGDSKKNQMSHGITVLVHMGMKDVHPEKYTVCSQLGFQSWSYSPRTNAWGRFMKSHGVLWFEWEWPLYA